MRKQELVHLHVLCGEIRVHLEAEHQIPDGAFERYDRFGVPPTAIYRSKEVHRQAVSLLLDDISDVLADKVPVSVDRTATD